MVGALEASAGKGGLSGGGEVAPEELDAEAEAAPVAGPSQCPVNVLADVSE